MQSADPALYQLLAEQVQDYAIFLLDTEGRIMSWNTGAARIKQYAAAEIIGRHFSQFYTEPDKARGWPAQELERAVAEGRIEDEGWRVRKDGTRFWANVVITALRDPKGKLLAFSKITRDLTERRRHEEALRQSEERFRLLVDGVLDYAIFMLDPAGTVTSWNLGAQRVLGYPAPEILGQHFSRFYDAQGIAAGKPAAELAIAREAGRAEDEGWRLRHDGSRFWARVVVTPLRDPDGRLRGYAKVTQDMTVQRHSQALEETAGKVNEFIAVLAHELRNPLAPIRTAATLMKTIQPGAPEYEMIRKAIDRQSAQLARIVDDLLDLNRITRGTFSVKRVQVNLADVVARAVESMRPAIDEKQHRLEVVQDGPLVVQGDELRLTQALTNLLSNAVRYTPPKGLISISVRRAIVKEGGTEAARAQISVRDTGRGIDRALLDAVFGMFVQGRSADDPASSGLGVGLSLSRSIIELHHGTIEANSEGPGRGSQFIISLPIPRDSRHQNAQAQDAEAAVPGGQKRVLVVDDNVDAAIMLSALVSQLGHQARAAYDGAEALSIAEGYRPEVVLLDLGMPGMDGLEVARRLRALQFVPRPRIIAVTGWGKGEDRARTREAGFDHHLVKPADESQLRKLLENGA